MAASRSVVVPENSGYGAFEIKEYINKATKWGTIFTAAFTLLLVLTYIGVGVVQDATRKKVMMAPIQKLKLQNLAADDAEMSEALPPPPPATVVSSGPAARAGTPVPVPEAELAEDLQEFADVDVLSRASAEGGDGEDMGDFSDNIDIDESANVDIDVREEEPDPEDFIPVEKEPACDMEDLRKRVVYPEMAKRAGIEGMVLVRALISKSGKVKKTIIQASDNSALNKAASTAVKNTVFTPAIQNKRAVQLWISIPVDFRLR